MPPLPKARPGSSATMSIMGTAIASMSRFRDSKNTIAFVIIVTTIAAFGLFTQVDVMTQGGPQNATSTVMFHAVQKGVREQDIAYGSTVTVIYFFIIAAIAIIQQRYFARGDT
jgi:multiple sugar transport system permease protein